MKKTLIAIFVILTIVAMIPIIGNKLVTDTLDTKIKSLESKGVRVKNSSENISYLKTSRHYEFLVEDTDKFLNYLSKYSREQLPPHTNALVSGTLVGVDLKYSNIPLSEDVSLDIYPLALSKNIMNDLKDKDEDFANYIGQFLKSKGILYHIDYNIISTDFRGFVKDIDENYTLKNNASIALNIADTNFEGSGDLIAPSHLTVLSKKTKLKILNSEEEISIDIDNFRSSSKFDNKNTYLLSANLDSLLINLKAPNRKKETINTSKVNVNISSNTQGKKAEINTKLSFDNMQLQLNNSDLNATSFNYDVAITELDKFIYEELRVLVSKSKVVNSKSLDSSIREAMIKLLSKGMKINIVDLSLININLDGEDLRGLKIKSDIKLIEDKHLAAKMMFSSLFILPNVDLDLKSKISKKILNEIVSNINLPISIVDYSKSTGEDAVLDLVYKRGSLKINGKSIIN